MGKRKAGWRVPPDAVHLELVGAHHDDIRLLLLLLLLLLLVEVCGHWGWLSVASVVGACSRAGRGVQGRAGEVGCLAVRDARRRVALWGARGVLIRARDSEARRCHIELWRARVG